MSNSAVAHNNNIHGNSIIIMVLKQRVLIIRKVKICAFSMVAGLRAARLRARAKLARGRRCDC